MIVDIVSVVVIGCIAIIVLALVIYSCGDD